MMLVLILVVLVLALTSAGCRKSGGSGGGYLGTPHHATS
jgi:hypothetical protein